MPKPAENGEAEEPTPVDRLRTGPMIERCQAVLELMCEREDSFWFLEPVDAAELPGYAEAVPRPMDLGTIRAKLERGEYAYEEGTLLFAADARTCTRTPSRTTGTPRTSATSPPKAGLRAFEGWFAAALAGETKLPDEGGPRAAAARGGW